MSNGNKNKCLVHKNFDKNGECLITAKKFFLPLMCLFLVLPLRLGAYEPAVLRDKYQFGLIDSGFYYYSSSDGLFGWMPKLKNVYSFCEDPKWAVRRSIVPGTMVDQRGVLYTTSLHSFDSSGPEFRLTETWYSNEKVSGSNGVVGIRQHVVDYYPWKWVYNKSGHTSADLKIDSSPKFDTGINSDKDKNKWALYNIFHPCIVQDVINDANSTYVCLLHYYPPDRMLGSAPVGAWRRSHGHGDEPPYIGGIVPLRYKKTELKPSEYNVAQYDMLITDEDEEGENTNETTSGDSNENNGGNAVEFDSSFYYGLIDDHGIDGREGNDKNLLAWGYALSRCVREKYVSGRSGGTAFSNCISNFQAFYGFRRVYFLHTCQTDNERIDERGGAIHCNCYGLQPFWQYLDGRGLLQTSCGIIPRFVNVGSYVYFATFFDGYYMRFYRAKGNVRTADDMAQYNLKRVEGVAECNLDVYVETKKRGHSEAPYVFDFCVLDKDGTPCTASSKDDDTKIICFFHVGGGKGNDDKGNLTEEYGWANDSKETYVNWGVRYVTGVLGSVVVSKNHVSYSQHGIDITNSSANAWSQNVIYVTNYNRYDGNFVDITSNGVDNLGKKNVISDDQRLYLNSHKIVPYTSPSGKHYIIYAYCYPGKAGGSGRIYLGYAQYFIDSNSTLRVIGKTEFKEAQNNTAWGDSFGEFSSGCNRIVSMDLRNGNLWITFLKNKDTEYYYFHILAKDLIRE